MTTPTIDIENAIAQSVFRNQIVHIECSRAEAEAALADLQCDEGHVGDVDANGTIEVWGDYHCAQGIQEWRIHFDIAEQ